MDYGEEHGKIFGHSQFGKVYEQGKRRALLISNSVMSMV